jgi:4-hydroxy-4-methyl-2-oxoglutarate aldolase
MSTDAWESLVEKTTSCSVSDVLMKQGKRQFMLQRLRQVGTKRVTGKALTISRRPLGSGAAGSALANSMMLQTIAEAPEGTVLVFDSPGVEAALWGGLLAATAVQLRLGGVVSDGPVRDPDEIAELGCPCFCTGAVPAGQAGLLELAFIGEPLQCGGVMVHTGDYVLGDASGVVVIPAGSEESTLRDAAEVEERDQQAMRMLRQGKSLLEVMQALGRA